MTSTDQVNFVVAEVLRTRRVLFALARSDPLLEDRGAHNLPNSYVPDISLALPTVLVGELSMSLKHISAHCNAKSDEFRSEILEPLIEKTLALFRGFLDVLLVHLGRLPTMEQNTLLVIKWFCLAAQDRLEEYYKYHSCWIFSKVHRQDTLINEMPNRPDWLPSHEKDGFLLGGWFYRMIRKFIFKGPSPKITAFMYALTNVKRAGHAISENKQKESLLSHMKNMRGAEYKPKLVKAKVDTRHKGTSIAYELTHEDVVPMIKHRMTCLMEKIYSVKRREPKWRVPSTRACWEFSAKKGGSHSLYHDFWASVSPTFLGFVSCKKYVGRVTPLYVPYLPDDLMGSAWAKFFGRPTGEPVRAQVHKVLEPFKARIITAGEGNIYQLGRCFQRQIHRRLFRSSSMFNLIGQPATPEFISEVYNDCFLTKEVVNKGDMTGFCAGDYKAATDGMRPDLSTFFVSEYARLSLLEDHEKRILDLCMEGHLLKYPIEVPEDLRCKPEDLTGIPEKDHKFMLRQCWGQLMGSPISFPILCLVNAAVNWVAADLYNGQPISYWDWIERHRPIFNGDDTSFLSNQAHYELWKSVASCAGLNPSLGKSYFSQDFVMINSEVYWMTKHQTLDDNVTRIRGCTRLGVLNPGLVKGQAKVIADTRTGEVAIFSDKGRFSEKRGNRDSDGISEHQVLLSMGAQLERAKRDLTLRADIIDAIFRTHVHERLKKSLRSWVLPRFLGGLGLTFGSVNYSQAMLASRCMKDPSLISEVCSYNRESPGYVLRANQALSELREALLISDEGSHRVCFDYSEPEEKEEDLDLSLYFIDGCPEEHGHDGISKLLRESRTNTEVSPIGPEFKKIMNRFRYVHEMPFMHLV